MDNVTRLKEAIRGDRIVLYGQRIVNLRKTDDRTASFEILSRLRDVNGELIAPAGFIPAAERFGLIEEMDRHIIAKSFSHLAGLDDETRKSVRYFINISAVTLSSATFPAYIEGLLLEHPDVVASQVGFEVTETAAITDIRRSAAAMQKLSALGFCFALDDFGSGMASFAYLQQLPVQYVKIDGDFIKNLSVNPVNAIIVEAVVKIAECMNIRTIAECIEDRKLLPMLRLLGVHCGQGFGLHRPENLDSVIERVRGERNNEPELPSPERPAADPDRRATRPRRYANRTRR